MMIFVRFLAAPLAALLLASCGTSTMPTSGDMDRYYEKARELTEDRVKELDGQLRRGEISQETYDSQAAAARARVPELASELAWARHASIESRERALGIPTGDHPVQVPVPSTGGGESFYRRAGQSGGENFSSSTPTGGSIFGGPNRGQRPQMPQQEPEPEPKPKPEPEEVVE